MNENYPYFELKNKDWQQIYNTYLPQVREINNDKDYYILMQNMLGELNDVHTGIINPALNKDFNWLGTVKKIDNKAVVTYIRPSVNIDGLEVGSVILEKNKKDITEYIESLNPIFKNGSTQEYREHLAYLRILAVKSNEKVRLTYLSPTGKRYTKEIKWKEEYNSQTLVQANQIIISRLMPSGIGVITINSFSSHFGKALIKEFDLALNNVFGAEGLIIDLRNNKGGSTFLSEPMAGRFISRPYFYGKEYKRTRLPIIGWAKILNYKINPRGETYLGPLAILTSVSNVSTCEQFVVSLVDSQRAVTIGENTGGSSGNPVTFHIPKGKVRFSLGAFYRNNGKPIEGKGIKPYIELKTSLADLKRGTDRTLLAAEDYLLAQIGR